MKRSKHEESPFLGLSDKLILEILYRLPVKSIGKCKLVCKSWHTLISDPNFAISHLDFSIDNNQPLTLISQKHDNLSRLEFRDPADITKGVTLARIETQFFGGLFDNDRYNFIVGSSGGLICVYAKETGKRRRGYDSMSLWNPCTNEDVEIDLPVQGGKFYVHIESSWFGYYDDDYKVFMVYTLHKRSDRLTDMYLYSLKEGDWTDVSEEGYDCISRAESVFLFGALHYLVERSKWIVIFDLDEETFKKVPFSIQPDERPEHHQLSLGVIGEYECLCAMFVHRSEEWMCELWTLEEYDDWDSWEKMYRIDLQEEIVRNCMQFLGFTYNGNLCIKQANGLVLVDTDCDPPSHIVARNPSFEKVYKVMDYVESLVSPSSFE